MLAKLLSSAIFGCRIDAARRKRREAATLTFVHIQQRDGRWVLIDLIGKRNKVRSVPMPNWTKQSLDEYASLAALKEGIVFRPINKGGRIAGERMTKQAIYNRVVEYGECSGFGKLAPHDLRCRSLNSHTRAEPGSTRSSYRSGTAFSKLLRGISELSKT